MSQMTTTMTQIFGFKNNIVFLLNNYVSYACIANPNKIFSISTKIFPMVNLEVFKLLVKSLMSQGTADEG